MFNYIVKSFKDAWKIFIGEILLLFSKGGDEYDNNMPLPLTRFFVLMIKTGITFSILSFPIYCFIKYVMGAEIGFMLFVVTSLISIFFAFNILDKEKI